MTAGPGQPPRRQGKSASRHGLPRRILSLSLAAVFVAGILWVAHVDLEIRYYARHDQARRADAIVVFGAAEYDGRPSPVLRDRLRHALALYRQGLAPLLITLGGKEAGDIYSEGGVGRAYLIENGVPEAHIIAETHSDNTEQSVANLAVIARKNNLRTIDVVSDGTHLFRIHELCKAYGLRVYTSPRPLGRPISESDHFRRVAHEIASYTAWRLHLH
jgi:uncharacterized SAM-binding protein YcdF (DUF218 family)